MALTEKQATDGLREIGEMFPTVRGLLNMKLKSDQRQGQLWAAILADSNLDADHYSNVCYELSRCEVVLPDPADRLPFYIIAECKDRKWKDQERARTHEIRLAGRKSPADFMGSDKIGVMACQLGAEVRRKWPNHLTRDCDEYRQAVKQAAERVEQLIAWDHGKSERPAFLDSMGTNQ